MRYDQQNIAITGEGTLDGQAGDAHWWPWKGAPIRMDDGRAELQRGAAAAAGDGGARRARGAARLRRGRLPAAAVHPAVPLPQRADRRRDDPNSPMWEIHPVLCENVTVRGVTSTATGPNNDGCDPESCRDVLIERCVFDTGDDCIAIKSGRNADGRRVQRAQREHHRPQLRDEGRARRRHDRQRDLRRLRNVFAQDCRMDSPQPRPRAAAQEQRDARRRARATSTCATSRSGRWPNAVLSIDFYYEEGDKGPFTPVVRDIEMRNVTSGRASTALYMRGFPNSPIEDVRVIDCRFDGVAKGNVLEHVTRTRRPGTTINGAQLGEQSRARASLARRLHCSRLVQPQRRCAAARRRPPPWSVRVAESVMWRNPVVFDRWDYTAGLVLLAISGSARSTGDPRYAAYVKRSIDSLVGPTAASRPTRRRNTTSTRSTRAASLFALADATRDPRYDRAADALRAQLRTQPRTAEGGFWHKQIYPEQMWLDGLYMAEPFYAQYARATATRRR